MSQTHLSFLAPYLREITRIDRKLPYGTFTNAASIYFNLRHAAAGTSRSRSGCAGLVAPLEEDTSQLAKQYLAKFYGMLYQIRYML